MNLSIKIYFILFLVAYVDKHLNLKSVLLSQSLIILLIIIQYDIQYIVRVEWTQSKWFIVLHHWFREQSWSISPRLFQVYCWDCKVWMTFFLLCMFALNLLFATQHIDSESKPEICEWRILHTRKTWDYFYFNGSGLIRWLNKILYQKIYLIEFENFNIRRVKIQW